MEGEVRKRGGIKANPCHCVLEADCRAGCRSSPCPQWAERSLVARGMGVWGGESCPLSPKHWPGWHHSQPRPPQGLSLPSSPQNQHPKSRPSPLHSEASSVHTPFIRPLLPAPFLLKEPTQNSLLPGRISGLPSTLWIFRGLLVFDFFIL